MALDSQKILSCFAFYLAQEGIQISRANAEQRMLEKLTRDLTEDIAPLLPAMVSFGQEDAIEAFNGIWRELICQIPGEPWKLSAERIAAFKNTKHPNLLG